MKRPLVWMGGFFLSTLAAAFLLQSIAGAVLAGLCGCALLWRRPRVALGCAVAVLLGGGCLGWHLQRDEMLAARLYAQGVPAQLVITGHEDYGSVHCYTAWACLQLEGGRRRQTVEVVSFSPLEGAVGDCFAATLILDEPASRWALAYSLANPLEVRLQGSPVWQSPQAGGAVAALARFREKAAGRAYRLAGGGEAGALMAALLTGNDRYIDRPLDDCLRRAGVAHLAVVSGLHLSVLCAAVAGGARRLRMGFVAQRLAAVGFAWAFAALVGFSPSLLRAAVMQTLYQLGLLAGEESDGLTSLAVAACLLCLWDPYGLLNLSFGLSFAATWGILAIGPALQRAVAALAGEKAAGSRVGRALCVTAGAQWGALPLSAGFFGMLPLASLPCNLLAGLLVPPMLVGGWFAWGLSLASEGLAGLPAGICRVLFSAFIALCRLAAGLPGAVWQILYGYQLAWLLIWAAAGMLWVTAGRVNARRLAAFAGAMVCSALLLQAAARPGSQLWLTLTPGADAALLERPGHEPVLLLLEERPGSRGIENLLARRSLGNIGQIEAFALEQALSLPPLWVAPLDGGGVEIGCGAQGGLKIVDGYVIMLENSPFLPSYAVGERCLRLRVLEGGSE